MLTYIRTDLVEAVASVNAVVFGGANTCCEFL